MERVGACHGCWERRHPSTRAAWDQLRGPSFFSHIWQAKSQEFLPWPVLSTTPTPLSSLLRRSPGLWPPRGSQDLSARESHGVGVKVEENCRIVHIWETGASLTRILICLSVQGSNPGASSVGAFGIRGMETAVLPVCVGSHVSWNSLPLPQLWTLSEPQAQNILQGVMFWSSARIWVCDLKGLVCSGGEGSTRVSPARTPTSLQPLLGPWSSFRHNLWGSLKCRCCLRGAAQPRSLG